MTGLRAFYVLVVYLHCLECSSGGVTLDKNYLKDEGVPSGRSRRQVLKFPVAPKTNPPGSAVLNESFILQSYEEELSTQEFLECISEEYNEQELESCSLGFEKHLGDHRLGDIIQACGENFFFQLADAKFYCSCTRTAMTCGLRKKRGSRNCKPLSDRMSCWQRELTLIPNCDARTSSVASTTTTEPTSTMRPTTSSTTKSSSVTSSTGDVASSNGPGGTIPVGKPSTNSPTVMLSVAQSEARLVGGVIGGVAAGVFITSIVVLLCCVCRGYIGNKYSVHEDGETNAAKHKEDDRKALCGAQSNNSNAGKDYHVYELPDVVGALPPYATCADVTEPELNSNDVEYNHLGDYSKQQQTVGTAHVYDLLDKTKEKSKQNVINNDYNHTSVEGEVTVVDERPDVSLTSVEVAVPEESQYSTIKENAEGADNPKYFVLETQDNTPNSPPYSTISVSDE